jgi:hypothetical protein
VTPAELTRLGEAMHQELGREYYLTGAGLKREAAFQTIYDRYATLLSDEALESARASGSGPMVEWIVGVRTGRVVAPLEERQLAWEQTAVVRVGERAIPYLRVPIELSNDPDRASRLAIDRERGRLIIAQLNEVRREWFAREHGALVELGYPNYVAGIAQLSGIDLAALGEACGSFLAQTADLYRAVLAPLVKRRVRVPLGELTRADTSWAFRARDYDAGFPLGTLVETAVRQMRDMGVDAHQSGRVQFDTEERPDKQPRAFCVPVRVPQEVYLVLRPRGGHQDYRTLWHEMGHAVHFASIDPARPFADRWLGDNSVTEGFAMLLDHLTVDAGWLSRYTGLTARQVKELRHELLVYDLYGVRRYAAKLGYELLLHAGNLSDGAGEYATRLTEATLFRYNEADWLVDVDPAFYAARYLRAWQLEAAVATELVERYDEDWYRNPRAGAFVQHVMSRGQAEPADKLVEELTGAPLSFGPLVKRLQAGLQ